MACEATGEDPISALGAATAVELFTIFTLLHDDIMDGATLRRGQQTVHQKWTILLNIVFFQEMLFWWRPTNTLNFYDDALFSELTKLPGRTSSYWFAEDNNVMLIFESQTQC